LHVTEHIDRASDPLFSYEIIPPLRGQSAQEIIDIVEQVMPYEPPFIDVTSHTAEARYEEMGDGTVLRRVRRKRPGMLSICGIVCNRYRIDTVAHLLCRGFTREETEDAMIELNFLGIHNVLAIRGDESNYKKQVGAGRSVNAYANELVEQLDALKRGVYLEDIANSEPIDMCIGVGAYPEKHVEAPNLKTDVKNLKRKVEAGADYVVTQMFYSNKYYFDFVDACRAEGIDVPIIPGLKVLDRVSQLTNLPKNFHITIPEELSDEIGANPDHVAEIGVRWCARQCAELLNGSVKCLHFYVMKDAASALEVVKDLRG
jgi:methylenetetrahydrofolate reductase (NADPH)